MSFAASKAGIEQDPHVHLSSSQMAWTDGAFLIAYAAGQFLFGIAGDRMGPRKVVLTGMLGSAIIGALMGASASVTFFVVLFFIQGLCQASGWAPLVKNVSNFFSQRERGSVWAYGAQTMRWED